VTGLTLDNCQHVILGCCDAAVGFLTTIGSIKQLRFAESTRLVTSGGKKLTITASKLPSPVHLLPSLALADYLSLSEKGALMRVLAAMSQREPREGCSVSEYLESLSCPKAVADLVFRPIAVAVLNEDPELASAKYARMAVLKGMLGDRRGFRIGTPTGPLSVVIADPAERYLQDRGAVVRASCPVERVNASGDRVESLTLRGGEEVRADVYVAAVRPNALEEVGLPTNARALPWRPIVSAHMVYEGDLPEFDSACVVDEPFGWVFNKTERSGDGRIHMHAVASAAGAIAGWSGRDLTQLAMRAVGFAMPESDGWKLVRSVICRQASATFSTSSGCDQLRPSETTPLQNLFLAGDWTATGWPSTIESAVLSGHAAAEAVLGLPARE
jgi:squalene-associated FAD-dependent desaturase